MSAPAPFSHARPAGRPERRISHRSAVATTLCGAPLTDRDMTPADMRKSLKIGWPGICPKCAELVRQSEEFANRYGGSGWKR